MTLIFEQARLTVADQGALAARIPLSFCGEDFVSPPRELQEVVGGKLACKPHMPCTIAVVCSTVLNSVTLLYLNQGLGECKMYPIQAASQKG